MPMVQTLCAHLTWTLTTHWSALWQMSVGGGGVSWAKEGGHATSRKAETSAVVEPKTRFDKGAARRAPRLATDRPTLAMASTAAGSGSDIGSSALAKTSATIRRPIDAHAPCGDRKRPTARFRGQSTATTEVPTAMPSG